MLQPRLHDVCSVTILFGCLRVGRHADQPYKLTAHMSKERRQQNRLSIETAPDRFSLRIVNSSSKVNCNAAPEVLRRGVTGSVIMSGIVVVTVHDGKELRSSDQVLEVLEHTSILRKRQAPSLIIEPHSASASCNRSGAILAS